MSRLSDSTRPCSPRWSTSGWCVDARWRASAAWRSATASSRCGWQPAELGEELLRPRMPLLRIELRDRGPRGSGAAVFACPELDFGIQIVQLDPVLFGSRRQPARLREIVPRGGQITPD